LKRLIIEKAVIDLPLPDSPTKPKISFFFNLKEMLFKIEIPEIERLSFLTTNKLDFFKIKRLAF